MLPPARLGRLPASGRSRCITSGHRGFYGNTSGYYGTVEQQGRLTLHLHMLLWIKGSLNPQDMRENLLKSDSTWQKKLIDWLENCHTGDFLTGTYTDVNESIITEREKEGYIDPTQSLPVPLMRRCVSVRANKNKDKQRTLVLGGSGYRRTETG